MKYSLKIAPPIGLFSERISFEHSPYIFISMMNSYQSVDFHDSNELLSK